MLNENDFINSVWDKYEDYSFKNKNNDKFFKKKVYRNSEYILALKSFMMTAISLLITTGIVYAGVSTYKIVQKSTNTDFNKNYTYDYNQNMILNNGMYYKKIDTYEEYNMAKNIWDNLIDMSEEDFNDNFMIILAGENYNTTGLYISNIYSKENKLFIELRKKENWDKNDTVISTKISKDLDSEHIEIVNLPNDIDSSKIYTSIDNITSDYSINTAISDNCFVINEKNLIVSNDKALLDNFIKNCNNKISDVIRICIYESNRTIICDMEFKDNKINMIEKLFVGSTVQINNYTGIGIKKIEIPKAAGGGYSYSLYDQIGNKNIICIIHDNF